MNEIQQIVKAIEQVKKYVSIIEPHPQQPDSSIVKNRAVKGLSSIIVQLAVLHRKMGAHMSKKHASVELCPNCRNILDRKLKIKQEKKNGE